MTISLTSLILCSNRSLTFDASIDIVKRPCAQSRMHEVRRPKKMSRITVMLVSAALSVVAYAGVLPFEQAQSRSRSSHEASESDSSLWSAWGFPPGTWLAGVELGFWNTVGTALQVGSLSSTILAVSVTCESCELRD